MLVPKSKYCLTMASKNKQQDIERHAERDANRSIVHREDNDNESFSDTEEPLDDHPSSANEDHPAGFDPGREMGNR